MTRLFKQIFYGIFFLFLFAGIIWVFYLWFFQPPPTCFDGKKNQNEQGIDCGGVCSKICIPSTIQPLAISSAPMIVRSTPQSISILAEVRNPNGGYAAENFSYQFTIYGRDDKVLGEAEGTSYIYGGEIKNIGVFNLPFPDVQSVEVTLGDPEWVQADSFQKPALVIQTQETVASPSDIQANGKFVNNDTISIPEVTVFAVFYNSSGKIGGISKNEFVNIAPGQVQDFSVVHPLFVDPDFSKTAVFVYGKRPVLPSSGQ
jgi:hypothetical protein